MSTRTRRTSTSSETPDLRVGDDTLESLSTEELEALLFEEDEEDSKGIWNLPTVAGLSLIVVGVAYIFQEMGLWSGFDIGAIAAMLPWLAGILIILLGFGVLSWRPKKKKKKVKKAVDLQSGQEKVVVETDALPKKKRLTKSRNKKIAGVCGGIAEYFNIDPTLVRIAFVIGLIVSQGTFLAAYILLSFVMPKPESLPPEERITIIRDH